MTGGSCSFRGISPFCYCSSSKKLHNLATSSRNSFNSWENDDGMLESNQAITMVCKHMQGTHNGMQEARQTQFLSGKLSKRNASRETSQVSKGTRNNGQNNITQVGHESRAKTKFKKSVEIELGITSCGLPQ